MVPVGRRAAPEDDAWPGAPWAQPLLPLAESVTSFYDRVGVLCLSDRVDSTTLTVRLPAKPESKEDPQFDMVATVIRRSARIWV